MESSLHLKIRFRDFYVRITRVFSRHVEAKTVLTNVQQRSLKNGRKNFQHTHAW